MRAASRLARSICSARPSRITLLSLAVAGSVILVTAIACAMASINAAFVEQLNTQVGTAEIRVQPRSGETMDDSVLGEVIVHGQDIAQPLGIDLTPNPVGVREVAMFFAAKDFAVNSRRMVKGLTLEAADADFTTGSGPLVRGRLVSLVMAMAGRRHALTELDGDGAAELRHRILREP